MTWLGNAGWRIDTGGDVTLVDPYVSRFDTGLARGAFDSQTPLTVDDDAISRYCPVASRVFVTHTHWDHFADVPAVAALTGAQVFGTRSTGLAARAMGVPARLTVDVQGGEVLDFRELVVEVVRSLHSRNAQHAILFAGSIHQDGPPPRTIADLPEGGTLSFIVGTPNGRRAYLSGASDVDSRALASARPDVACIPVPASDATSEYLPRLLEALDRPRTVVAVHWDNFDAPLGRGAKPLNADARRRLERFVHDVRRVSPRSTVHVPEHLDTLPL